MRKYIGAIILLLMCSNGYAQPMARVVDSLRVVYGIPELNYAVVSADKVLEMKALGIKKVNSDQKADIKDLFRIGSNTKPITGFLAALLVKRGRIGWHTKFFDLFPELKEGSNKKYYDITLLQLLTFRSGLSKYTYTDAEPNVGQITGTEAEQRYQFAAWCLKQRPTVGKDGLSFSNPGYVLAGMMLERATGATYTELITNMGKELNIEFYFGQPNNRYGWQPWGHNEELQPEPPGENVKLNWLLPAGNIAMSVPEYAKFAQLQLSGLAGKSSLMSDTDYHFLHYGFPTFSVGWFSDIDENKHSYSSHTGNPGTFISKVYVFGELNLAFILFTNVQSARAEEGLEAVYDQLSKYYIR